jgi:hypothetical protein
MAGLMAGVAIMLILSSVAFQEWADILRRDNEAEMIFRAQDLVRGIQRYRKDHGGVAPLKLEDLLEPGPKGQYYLRKLWTDPLVADGKWGLLHIGPGGAIIDPNAEGAEGGIPGLGGLSGGLGGLGNDRDNEPGLGRRNPQRLTPGQLSKNPGVGAMTGVSARPGQQGQMEGLPIAGVRTLCEEKPFRYYKGMTEYREWLFTYLDLEMQQVPGGDRQLGVGGRTGQGPFGGGQGRGGPGQGGLGPGGRGQGGIAPGGGRTGPRNRGAAGGSSPQLDRPPG